MEALVYTAPFSVELQELPAPSPQPGEVLLRVSACGICGSDVHGFRGKSRIRVPPVILGHEFSGSVVELGPDVAAVRVGDRAVVQPLVGCGRCAHCRSGRPNICPHRRLLGAHRPGGFAEYICVPASAVYPIPDTVSDIDATLVEPLGNALHVMGLGAEAAHGNVVVIGAGTLGLLTVAALWLKGAQHVISVDLDRGRLEIASKLGAGHTLPAGDPGLIERILDLTAGGASLVVEAVGVTASRRTAIETAAPGGTVVLLGNAEQESSLPVNDAVNRELSLRGSYSCTDAELREAIEILASGAIDTTWVETLPLRAGPAVFGRLDAGEPGLIKAILLP